MNKVTWRGGTLLAPLPVVLVSSGTLEKPNVMTAAWTGIINTIPAKTYVSIRPERYSHEIISNTREFVINLTTTELVYATDFCGVKSGRKLDKFKEMKLTAQKVTQIDAPAIGESPVNLECKVTDIIKLGSHDMFIADIVAVNVDEKLVDKNGKLNLDRAKLIAYSHGEYFELGKKLGKFGYSVQKKKK